MTGESGVPGARDVMIQAAATRAAVMRSWDAAGRRKKHGAPGAWRQFPGVCLALLIVVLLLLPPASVCTLCEADGARRRRDTPELLAGKEDAGDPPG